MCNQSECITADVPMNKTTDFDQFSLERVNSEFSGLREIIGPLLYLAKYTRPDISYAVGRLLQFLDSSNKSHYTAALNICQYLKGTRHLGIKYSENMKPECIHGYNDSSYGDCVN